ncbi:hypothetical protein [Methanobrevibacter filiformis]|uniref:Uncharacterized protein n=1 Tax=Methanobrevibacter filiformis TaxID=55758 RepID=A0A166C0B6_9EURY|nr:hypothetical protein [Methanobrevibacter filiformis]KZX10297.1 hypothetical protein MBFIL_18230 [Methanobrevibacter filiformis]
MKLKIIKAENQSEIGDLTQKFLDNKFKIVSEDDSFILFKKVRYGDIKVHILCIILALSVTQPFVILNVIYFGYNVFKRSEAVLITTETLDSNGNHLEFSNLDDISIFNENSNKIDSNLNSLKNKFKNIFNKK